VKSLTIPPGNSSRQPTILCLFVKSRFISQTLLPCSVRNEMALNVLAYNLPRVMNIVGIKPLLMAIRA
jgi:hypothetical protein